MPKSKYDCVPTAPPVIGSFDHYGVSVYTSMCHFLPNLAVMISLFKWVSYNAHKVASTVACSSTHRAFWCISWTLTLRGNANLQHETVSRFPCLRQRTEERVCELFISSFTYLIQVIRQWHPWKSQEWPLIRHLCVCNDRAESQAVINLLWQSEAIESQRHIIIIRLRNSQLNETCNGILTHFHVDIMSRLTLWHAPGL